MLFILVDTSWLHQSHLAGLPVNYVGFVNHLNSALIYHTQVRWLSKKSMLSCIFEQREEVELFLNVKQKMICCLAFSGDGFSMCIKSTKQGAARFRKKHNNAH